MSHDPKLLIFLGQKFATQEDFRRAFPAYSQYADVVAKGADTPHKIELVIYERANRGRRNQKRNAISFSKKPKKARQAA